MLIAVVQGTDFERDIVALLTGIARESPMSLYQCSCAGVVGHMLSILPDKSDDCAFVLLTLVASAFFGRSDLGMVLTALADPSSKSILKLSDLCRHCEIISLNYTAIILLC